MTRAKADLLLLFAAVVWGMAFFFQKTAMDHIGPLLFLAARSIMAALVLAPIAWRERAAAPLTAARRLDFGRVVMSGGVLFFVAAALQQVGLVTATVTNSGFLTGLYVVLTPLLMWLVYAKYPSTVVTVAVGLAFGGMWMLGGGTVGGFSAGDYLVALCAVFWAFHLLVTASSSQFGRPILFTCLQFVIVGALALAGAAMTETVTISGLLAAWREILFVGVLSSALTFTILAIAIKHTPAPEAAILMSMEMVIAALAGALFLGERLTALGWCGAAMMFSASLLVPLAPVIEAKWRKAR